MDNETKTASEMWDIMEELGIAVDKSFFEPCDLTPPTLEELCRMFGVNSLEELRNMPPSPMAFDINKNEFMRRFNKYGFGVVPATTVINNYDNE